MITLFQLLGWCPKLYNPNREPPKHEHPLNNVNPEIQGGEGPKQGYLNSKDKLKRIQIVRPTACWSLQLMLQMTGDIK